MFPKNNRSVASAGLGIAGASHAVGAATVVRVAGAATAASPETQEIDRAIAVVLTWCRNAVAGDADLPFLAHVAGRASTNARLGTKGITAWGCGAADTVSIASLALAVRATRRNHPAKSARLVSPGRNTRVVLAAVCISAALVGAERPAPGRASSASSAAHASASRVLAASCRRDAACVTDTAGGSAKQRGPAARAEDQETGEQHPSKAHC